MKKLSFLPIAIAAVLLSGPVSAQTGLQLPPGNVTYSGLIQNSLTQTAVAGGQAYFSLTLGNVPAGYTVLNQSYPSWCGDWFNATSLGATFPGTSYPLYSTLGAVPAGYAPLNGNFAQINYILNHKSGTVQDVQDALWLIITGNSGDTPSAAAQAMFNAAKASGTSYVPGPGQVVGVLFAINPIAQNTIQNQIIEVVVPGNGNTTQCLGCTPTLTVPATNLTYNGLTQNPGTNNATNGGPGFFALNLMGVPAGFTVNNQTYTAWCGDWFNATSLGATFPGTSYPVYSTLGPVPTGYAPQNGNFNEVNYILNHKSGTIQDVQDALWLVITGNSGDTPSAAALAMYNAAVQNGSTFVPCAGQIAAVLFAINPIAQNTVQNMLLEVTLSCNGSGGNLPTGAIGDFIFSDLNRNGVQDAGEPGINGVTVNLLSSAGAVIATTTTATQGSQTGYYQFTGLAAGTYQVQVVTSSAPLAGLTASPAGQGTTATDSNTNPATVTLATNSSTDQTIDFGFYSPCTGTIGDFVFNDTNGNGIQEAGEAGLSGVKLTITGAGGFTATATTAGDGSYRFNGLCSGSYTVSVTASTVPASFTASPSVQGNNTALDSNASPATVLLNANNSVDNTVDFGFHAPCASSIGSIVFNDQNGNGILDSTEAGINGVKLSLFDAAHSQTLTTTTMQLNGVNGSYVFPGLCPGSYTVTVDNTTVPANYGMSPKNVTVPAGGVNSVGSPATVVLPATTVVNTTTNFGYQPPCTGTIGDFIFSDANGNGVQDSGETALAGVIVNLRKSSDNSLLQTTTSTAGLPGNYSFNGLCAGSYVVQVVSPAGYLTSPTGAGTAATDSNVNPTTVVLASNSASDLTNDFGFYQLGTISGTVYNDVNTNKAFDGSDNGLSGITVTLNGTDLAGRKVTLTTVTGANGSYSFPNLFAGSYTVTSPATAGTETLETAGTLAVTLSAGGTSVNNNFGYVVPVVVTPITVICASSTAQVGVPYSSSVAASGGYAPYTFSVASGSLPAGLTLNTSTGAITGTPTAAGAVTFSIKVVDSRGTVAYTACAQGCTTGSTYTWDFSAAKGKLGNSQIFTSNGLLITAYGFTNAGVPTALYGRTDGGTENGLGIDSTSSDHEIDVNTFIQLDLANVISSGATSAQIMLNSVQGGESYNIYGSNTLGSLGTQLVSAGTLGQTFFNMPGFPTYRYFGVRAAAADILLGAASFTYNCNCTITAAPQTMVTVSGTVFTDKNVNKTLDSGDTGIGGVTVTITGTDSFGKAFSTTVVTASNGTYSVNLPPGTYTATVPGTVGTSTNNTGTSITGTIVAGGTYTGINFGYVAPVVVTSPLTLACASNTAQVNTSYNSSVVVAGGAAPYTFAIASGSLPAGLTLNTATGAITGTPTKSGLASFSIKVTDSKGTVAYSTCSQSCSASTSYTWNLAANSGNLGASAIYTAAGISIPVYGYNGNGTPAALYGTTGNGNAGLGIAGTSGNQIDTTHYVQLDLGAIIAAKGQNARIQMNGLSGGEKFNIYGSNSLGVLGTKLVSDSDSCNDLFSIPSFGDYRYISIQATSGNLVINSVLFCVPVTCTIDVKAAASALGTISGVLYYDSNHNWSYGSGDLGLANVTVTLVSKGKDCDDRSVWVTTKTDANGKYSFTGLAAGSYAVLVPWGTNNDAIETQAILTPTLSAGATSSNNNFGYIANGGGWWGSGWGWW